jgi:hypothetical protein
MPMQPPLFDVDSRVKVLTAIGSGALLLYIRNMTPYEDILMALGLFLLAMGGMGLVAVVTKGGE